MNDFDDNSSDGEGDIAFCLPKYTSCESSTNWQWSAATCKQPPGAFTLLYLQLPEIKCLCVNHLPRRIFYASTSAYAGGLRLSYDAGIESPELRQSMEDYDSSAKLGISLRRRAKVGGPGSDRGGPDDIVMEDRHDQVESQEEACLQSIHVKYAHLCSSHNVFGSGM